MQKYLHTTVCTIDSMHRMPTSFAIILLTCIPFTMPSMALYLYKMPLHAPAVPLHCQFDGKKPLYIEYSPTADQVDLLI